MPPYEENYGRHLLACVRAWKYASHPTGGEMGSCPSASPGAVRSLNHPLCGAVSRVKKESRGDCGKDMRECGWIGIML